jgi:hypothetical protein
LKSLKNWVFSLALCSLALTACQKAATPSRWKLAAGQHPELQNQASAGPAIDPNWVGHWANPDRDDQDEIDIGADGSFVKVQTRQVGARSTAETPKPEVPYPTVCRYRSVGRIVGVTKLAAEEKGAPEVRLEYGVSKTELLTDAPNDAACPRFVEYLNRGYPAGSDGIRFTMGIEFRLSDAETMEMPLLPVPLKKQTGP